MNQRANDVSTPGANEPPPSYDIEWSDMSEEGDVHPQPPLELIGDEEKTPETPEQIPNPLRFF